MHRRRRAGSDREDLHTDADERVCRICRGGPIEDDERELFQPCNCVGSLSFVHEECCETWLQRSESDWNSKKCEICSAQIRFSEVPDPLPPLPPWGLWRALYRDLGSRIANFNATHKLAAFASAAIVWTRSRRAVALLAILAARLTTGLVLFHLLVGNGAGGSHAQSRFRLVKTHPFMPRSAPNTRHHARHNGSHPAEASFFQLADFVSMLGENLMAVFVIAWAVEEFERAVGDACASRVQASREGGDGSNVPDLPAGSMYAWTLPAAKPGPLGNFTLEEAPPRAFYRLLFLRILGCFVTTVTALIASLLCRASLPWLPCHVTTFKRTGGLAGICFCLLERGPFLGLKLPAFAVVIKASCWPFRVLAKSESPPLGWLWAPDIDPRYRWLAKAAGFLLSVAALFSAFCTFIVLLSAPVALTRIPSLLVQFRMRLHTPAPATDVAAPSCDLLAVTLLALLCHCITLFIFPFLRHAYQSANVLARYILMYVFIVEMPAILGSFLFFGSGAVTIKEPDPEAKQCILCYDSLWFFIDCWAAGALFLALLASRAGRLLLGDAAHSRWRPVMRGEGDPGTLFTALALVLVPTATAGAARKLYGKAAANLVVRGAARAFAGLRAVALVRGWILETERRARTALLPGGVRGRQRRLLNRVDVDADAEATSGS